MPLQCYKCMGAPMCTDTLLPARRHRQGGPSAPQRLGSLCSLTSQVSASASKHGIQAVKIFKQSGLLGLLLLRSRKEP